MRNGVVVRNARKSAVFFSTGSCVKDTRTDDRRGERGRQRERGGERERKEGPICAGFALLLTLCVQAPPEHFVAVQAWVKKKALLVLL